MDAIVEFMMDGEYQSLDELSKSTLVSYSVKALKNVGQKSLVAKHLRRTADDQDTEYAHKAANQNRAEADKIETKAASRLGNVGRAGYRIRKESTELEEAHGGTFNVGDVVSVDYHDISGKTYHGKANVDKATKGFVHVQHPSINGLVLKFHQTVNGKATSNEVGTLPGTRAGGHRITKLNESTADLNIQRYAAMIGKNLIKE